MRIYCLSIFTIFVLVSNFSQELISFKVIKKESELDKAH